MIDGYQNVAIPGQVASFSFCYSIVISYTPRFLWFLDRHVDFRWRRFTWYHQTPPLAEVLMP